MIAGIGNYFGHRARLHDADFRIDVADNVPQSGGQGGIVPGPDDQPHVWRQAETGKDMLSYLGDPDVDFARLASAFGVTGEQVTTPEQIKPAVKRATQAAAEGKPYLIDVLVGRYWCRSRNSLVSQIVGGCNAHP